MSSGRRRINGWKSIAAHIGRDRATVIRWALARGLPVRRMPGGERATVFAYDTELNDWTSGQDWIGETNGSDADREKRFPLAPDAAVLYMEARSDWASRDREAMIRAINGYEAVTQMEPGFAPAYVGLADCYILVGDYGHLSYAESYPKARRAAQAALVIDPQLAAAHRALGSVHFFWARDTRQAGEAFRQAIALAPADALARIWYGNALIDNCEFEAARRHHNQARLMDVGPIPLSVNQAWMSCLTDSLGEGINQLAALAKRYPDNALIYDFLSLAMLGEGDIDGYLESLRTCEAHRGLPDAVSRAHRMKQARDEAGIAGFVDAALALNQADEADRPRPDHAMAAYFASSAGDRQRLLELLLRADTDDERWAAGWIGHLIGKRWKDDAVICGLLENRPALRMEPD